MSGDFVFDDPHLDMSGQPDVSSLVKWDVGFATL
jgi:hypothetical protein